MTKRNDQEIRLLTYSLKEYYVLLIPLPTTLHNKL